MSIRIQIGYAANICAVIFLLCSFAPEIAAQSRTFITNGVYNGNKVDFSSSRVPLNGHWDFYPGVLLEPAMLHEQKPTSLLVPSLWNDHKNLENTGCATYSLKLVLPAIEGEYGLEIPQLYNSYKLFIGDSLYASNGSPARTKEESMVQWKPQYVAFPAANDTIQLVLQLSNFHHYKAGIREPIYLGKASVVKNHFRNALISVYVEVTLLVILASVFLFLYVGLGKRRISLYFALLCLSWAMRELFSDIYPISSMFPGINWFLLIRTEYIMLFLIIIFGTLFISRIFRELASQIFKYLIVGINCVFILFTLVAPVMFFTRWLSLYLIMALVVLLYAGVLIIRAMIVEKPGVWYLLIGLMLSVIATGYDLIAYKGILANHVMIGSICYTLIYLCSAIGLLQYLKIITTASQKSNTLTYQDLYR